MRSPSASVCGAGWAALVGLAAPAMMLWGVVRVGVLQSGAVALSEGGGVLGLSRRHQDYE